DVVKGEVSQLQARLQSIDESQPVVFTLVLGSGKYDSWAISQYSAALSQFRSFHTVVFVDKDKHFVACMGARAFRDTLSVQTLADELLRSVNDDDRKTLRRFPGVVTKTISPDYTAAEALREMQNLNLGSLLVTDQDKKVLGMVEREDLLSRILLSLLK